MKIEFPEGYITLRTQNAIELVEHHLTEGTFWDFIAVLVEEKVESKVDKHLEEIKLMMDLMKSQLDSGSSRGATMQHNSSLPSPDIFGVAEEKDQFVAEKVEIDMSVMGDFALLLARANEMGGD